MFFDELTVQNIGASPPRAKLQKGLGNKRSRGRGGGKGSSCLKSLGGEVKEERGGEGKGGPGLSWLGPGCAPASSTPWPP